MLFLAIDKNRTAYGCPKTDDRPLFYFPFGDEYRREDAAQNQTIDVAEVIGDDYPAARQHGFRIAIYFDVEIQDCSQKKREAIRQPTDDGPAVR